MELVNSGQNLNIANIAMEFLMQNKDTNLNNCYSYSLDERLRRGEQSCSIPTPSFFFQKISKVKNQGEVPFMIPGNVRKKFENFTRYINSKEHLLLKETMNHWKDMSSNYSGFLPAPREYSDVSNSIPSYLIGGFVGSKSQMNNEKHKLSYDLGGAIFKMLHNCKFDKPYYKLREEKKFELNKYGKKAKSSTQENNVFFQDVVFCKNLINRNVNKTNVKAETSDCLMKHDISTFTATKVEYEIDGNCPKITMNQLECDETITAGGTDEDSLQANHYGVDSRCLKTSFIEPADNTEEQISCYQGYEEQSVANNEKDARLNKEQLGNDERSDVNFFISLPPTSLPFGIRRRQSSECSVESADSDSFIVFDDKCCEELTNLVLEESENDESDFCSEDECSDGNQADGDKECCQAEATDEYDNAIEEREVAEANARWSQLYNDVAKDVDKYERKVRFNDEVKIHRMVAWDYAYRAARPGPWEQMAHDRGRFKERIQRLSTVISPVLLEDHRKRVHNKLYG